MKRSVSIILCLLIAVSVIASGCGSKQEESTATEPSTQKTTAAPTTAAATTNPATADSAADKNEYDFVAIKKKSGEIISQFDKIVDRNKFSGSIYMKLGNDFEYISSTGSANADKHIDNSINTLFYAGDITKQFTAAAVMKLSEQKKLNLDDKLTKFFPDYEHADKISVKQLLNMTSGIKSYICHNDITKPSNYLVNDLNGAITENNSFEENKSVILNWIFSQKLNFDPGTKFDASESNYYLLGEIISKVSSQPYQSYIEKELFKPIGMGSSGFEANNKIALPYDKGPTTQSLFYKGVGYSAFGMISNVSDLLKWTDSLLNAQVLSPQSFTQMFSNQISSVKDAKKSYGFGVEINGKNVLSSGRYDAFGTIFTYKTDKSEIYVSLTNHTPSDDKLVRESFKKVLQKYAV